MEMSCQQIITKKKFLYAKNDTRYIFSDLIKSNWSIIMFGHFQLVNSFLIINLIIAFEEHQRLFEKNNSLFKEIKKFKEDIDDEDMSFWRISIQTKLGDKICEFIENFSKNNPSIDLTSINKAVENYKKAKERICLLEEKFELEFITKIENSTQGELVPVIWLNHEINLPLENTPYSEEKCLSELLPKMTKDVLENKKGFIPVYLSILLIPDHIDLKLVWHNKANIRKANTGVCVGEGVPVQHSWSIIHSSNRRAVLENNDESQNRIIRINKKFPETKRHENSELEKNISVFFNISQEENPKKEKIFEYKSSGALNWNATSVPAPKENITIETTWTPYSYEQSKYDITPYIVSKKHAWKELAELANDFIKHITHVVKTRETVYENIKNFNDVYDQLKLNNKVDLEKLRMTDVQGYSFLHRAVLEDNFDLVEQLIKLELDVNIPNRINHKTPFHTACEKGSKKMIECLRKHKANISILDYENKSPLYYALLNPNSVLLIDKDSLDDDLINSLMGNEPQIKVCHRLANPNVSLLLRNFVINKFPNLNIQDPDDGTTLAHHLIANSNYELLEFLYSEKKLVLNLKDNLGRTPLQYLFMMSSIPISLIEFFVKNLTKDIEYAYLLNKILRLNRFNELSEICQEKTREKLSTRPKLLLTKDYDNNTLFYLLITFHPKSMQFPLNMSYQQQEKIGAFIAEQPNEHLRLIRNKDDKDNAFFWFIREPKCMEFLINLPKEQQQEIGKAIILDKKSVCLLWTRPKRNNSNERRFRTIHYLMRDLNGIKFLLNLRKEEQEKISDECINSPEKFLSEFKLEDHKENLVTLLLGNWDWMNFLIASIDKKFLSPSNDNISVKFFKDVKNPFQKQFIEEFNKKLPTKINLQIFDSLLAHAAGKNFFNLLIMKNDSFCERIVSLLDTACLNRMIISENKETNTFIECFTEKAWEKILQGFMSIAVLDEQLKFIEFFVNQRSINTNLSIIALLHGLCKNEQSTLATFELYGKLIGLNKVLENKEDYLKTLDLLCVNRKITFEIFNYFIDASKGCFVNYNRLFDCSLDARRYDLSEFLINKNLCNINGTIDWNSSILEKTLERVDMESFKFLVKKGVLLKAENLKILFKFYCSTENIPCILSAWLLLKPEHFENNEKCIKWQTENKDKLSCKKFFFLKSLCGRKLNYDAIHNLICPSLEKNFSPTFFNGNLNEVFVFIIDKAFAIVKQLFDMKEQEFNKLEVNNKTSLPCNDKNFSI